jgi:hypothetical protein
MDAYITSTAVRVPLVQGKTSNTPLVIPGEVGEAVNDKFAHQLTKLLGDGQHAPFVSNLRDSYPKPTTKIVLENGQSEDTRQISQDKSRERNNRLASIPGSASAAPQGNHITPSAPGTQRAPARDQSELFPEGEPAKGSVYPPMTFQFNPDITSFPRQVAFTPMDLQKAAPAASAAL